MRIQHSIALVAVAAGFLALTACEAPTESPAGRDPKPGGSVPAGSAAPPATTAPPAKSRKATLPNLVGKGLQSAQDEAQAAGFPLLKSHDSLGRDRNQVLDRAWKVCTQTPAAGSGVDTGTTVDFGTVTLEETCPDGDVAAPKPAGDTMPDFVGQGMKAVRGALPSNASITVKDATAQGRMVLQESNWKVCTQTPKAGATLSGAPVAFTVVKTGESCP
ncbi:PASTA domain-containing protein [Streptomyces sp. H27-G5]|uniref:PASTA domain-containing protein n=1 Tax=Streptomyces sp. H27-G5 TaxID=2996698 RepID=UPI002270A96F|nr:PASTA domain-containing protein [Streptomyces sp. H27-G5]MCY0923039.1 PASTA domain-containing protein [Streptomyces sp. H27-G5]